MKIGRTVRRSSANGAGYRFAIVVSRFNVTITNSTIQHSASGGIALSGGTNAHWNADIATSNTFADNAGTNVIFP